MEIKVEQAKIMCHMELNELAQLVIEVMDRLKNEKDEEVEDMEEIELPSDIADWINDNAKSISIIREIMKEL